MCLLIDKIFLDVSENTLLVNRHFDRFVYHQKYDHQVAAMSSRRQLAHRQAAPAPAVAPEVPASAGSAPRSPALSSAAYHVSNWPSFRLN